jgi:hypothetical protein
MTTILALIGIIASFFMLKYRERLGDMIGEADWMNKVGGVYNLVIIVSILIFFWCVAELTGTTDVLFKPLIYLLPGAQSNTPTQDFIIE